MPSARFSEPRLNESHPNSGDDRCAETSRGQGRCARPGPPNAGVRTTGPTPTHCSNCRGGAAWSEEEKAALAASLQDFQLGESSEGRHLLDRARLYADDTGDPEYAEAMQLFIREEQRHARDLGEFLLLAGVPLLQRTRLD